MKYKIKTKVKSIEQVSRVLRAWKVKEEVLQDTELLGWFVCFEGSHERLFLGFARPELREGQSVEITIEGL